MIGEDFKRRLSHNQWVILSAIGHGVVTLVFAGLGWLIGYPFDVARTGWAIGALFGFGFYAGREARDMELDQDHQGTDLDFVIPLAVTLLCLYVYFRWM